MTLVKLKQDIIVYYIKKRIKENRNALILFSGPTGSGKSYGSLNLAERLDDSFNISRVAFNAREFMNIITTQELKAGATIVWDEVGIGQSSRSWQSISNKAINFVMQSFRKLNLVVLFTAPDISFLDSQTRKLIHGVFETQSIDQKEKVLKVKPLFTQLSQRSGKLYVKYLRVETPDGVSPLVSYRLGLPSQKLIDDYEAKKHAFLQDLNKRVYYELDNLDKKERPKETAITKPKLTPQQERVVMLLKEGKLIPEVARELNVKVDAIYGHLGYIKKKNVTIKPIKEKDRVLRYEVLGY